MIFCVDSSIRIKLFSLLFFISMGSLKGQKIESFWWNSPCMSAYEKYPSENVNLPDWMDPPMIIDRIIALEFNAVESELFIAFGNTSNCAGMSNPIVISSNDTLRIRYRDYVPKIDTISIEKMLNEDGIEIEVVKTLEYGDVLSCDCYFESEYSLSGISNFPKVILLQGKQIFLRQNKFATYQKVQDTIDGQIFIHYLIDKN